MEAVREVAEEQDEEQEAVTRQRSSWPVLPRMKISRTHTGGSFDGGGSTPSGLRSLVSTPINDLMFKPVAEQARFWAKLAYQLGPWKYSKPQIDVDAIARYFDGTWAGIEYMFDREARKMQPYDTLCKESLYNLLVQKWGFMAGKEKEAAMQEEGFLDLCNLVLNDDVQVTKASFDKAIRTLRIAKLLGFPRKDKKWSLYYYNFDEGQIEGSSVPSTEAQRKFKNNDWVMEPIVATQKACGADISGMPTIEEFFMNEPLMQPGKVHWVHAHRPCNELLLALGQHYRLRVHAQCLLARLDEATAQIELSENFQDWSTVIFPAVYMDRECRRSFQNYQVWYYRKAKEAKMSGYLGQKTRWKEKNLDVPSFHIGVVKMNLMMLWSVRENSTVVSVGGEPRYHASWSTPTIEDGKSWPVRIFEAIFCRCARRGDGENSPKPKAPRAQLDRGRTVGNILRPYSSYSGETSSYGATSPLTTPREEADMRDLESLDWEEDPDDLEDEIEGVFESRFRQFEMSAAAERCTQFEDTFGPLLVQLSQAHSVLRMGSHAQLLYRMLLNRSYEYLNVLTMYSAAISQLTELLNNKNYTGKDSLIMRVSVAKLELENLLKTLEPFAENVLPLLPARIDPTRDDDILACRICRHHKFDLDNNIIEFIGGCKERIRQCQSLIEEYDRKSKDQVNSILNFLTIIMFVIAPLQILTGVYGMNFKHMPELDWRYGYHYFFGLAAVVTMLTAAILTCAYKLTTT